FFPDAGAESVAKIAPDCPPDKPRVNCFVDPCWSVKCPAGTTCVANYCGGCNAECKPDGCFYGGVYHAVGTSFPDIYSCNTCFCTAGNIVGCTKIYCPRCWYNGQKYKPGDSFKSTDGCNKCWCTSDGTVGCTKRACLKHTLS
ncbi:kielin/chordin-like protein, partial [Liolophura sinensis]|uniref:kielin/chordin-like protein n=1 Tax=Liolophura sinensis TaxID=3198878 RepID=UPI00315891AA